MTDARSEASLVEKHRDELWILRVLRVQTLNRNRAREPNRPEEPPVVHGRHTARRDGIVDGVPAEDPRSWALIDRAWHNRNEPLT
jgi:hypothetical protein